MRRSSIALVLLLVAPLVSAQVYKWTDAQGTTHYSETPPAVGTKYSQVTVSGTEVPAAQGQDNAAASSSSSSSSSQSSDSTQTVADTPENRAKMCASIKANITTLQGSAPVVTQTAGQQQLLSADQRKQQLDASQSQYQQYCAQ